MKKLQHKFFVNIYEYCEIDLPEAARGVLMELADTNLDKEVLKQATVAGKELDVQWLEECRNWMVQMVCAVRYMHGKCIVHRGLKPQNVLLVCTTGGLNANQKEIKLTDFGLSVEVQSPDQELHERVRTDDYFPHLAMPYTMKCDVFSLGRTFASILQRRKTDNEGNSMLDPVFDVGSYPYPDPLQSLLHRMCKNFDSYRPSIDAVTSDPFFGQFDYNSKRFETLMEEGRMAQMVYAVECECHIATEKLFFQSSPPRMLESYFVFTTKHTFRHKDMRPFWKETHLILQDSYFSKIRTTRETK